MRISYPRSFLSLLLIGFSIVAAPLVFALFANAVAFEKLAALSEQAVLTAVRVTQASRALTTNVASLERTARQYAVAGEASFLDAYRANRAAFTATLRTLDDMPLSDRPPSPGRRKRSAPACRARRPRPRCRCGSPPISPTSPAGRRHWPPSVTT
jgi:hypothetical protein